MKKIYLLSCVLATSLFAADIKFKEASNNFERLNAAKQNVVLSYYNSIKDAKESVVNISTTKTIIGNGGIEEIIIDPFFRDFFEQIIPRKEQRQKKKSHSLGSGVIISADGYIITNNHVIEGAEEISVTLASGDKEYKAKLIGADAKTDLAVIKIEAKELPAIHIADSSKLLEGDIVFAIGNPFGVGESITKGIISALNKDNIGINQYENFIQTDASINPGNSGGALVDSRGALVGINTAILSRSGASNGIGFAIPSNMVKQIATQLITDGKIDRGYLGVSIANLNSSQKELYKNKEGALITGVQSGAPADKAGIKRGDLIIAVDSKPIKNASDLKYTIGSKAPDSTIEIKYERSGKIIKTSIKLSNMDIGSENIPSNDIIQGLKVSELTDELRYRLRLNKNIGGILVSKVTPNSKADQTGFESGDVIVQAGDETIASIKDFAKIVKENAGKKLIVWVIRKNGETEGLVLK